MKTALRLFAAGPAVALAAAGLALASCNQTNSPEGAALADRIAIEDLVTEYYGHLGSGETSDIAKYFTQDAVLDVNGIVATGHEEIEALYAMTGGEDESGESPSEVGTFHMLLSNPRISVNGDTATAQFVWTGVLNEDIKLPARLLEQGREYDRLVKVDGRWLFQKRVIIADSGLPDSYDATYLPRKNYDLTKDP